MIIKNKKILSIACGIVLFCGGNVSAAPVNAVQEYTLENGMQVFLLEDPGDAQIHVEYTCRAGFSSQTQSTCGFFKLYTRLIKSSNPSISFRDIQCNADSSRYFLDVSPAELENTLFELSEAIFENNLCLLI